MQLVRQNLLGEAANARDIKIESRPFDYRGIIRRGLLSEIFESTTERIWKFWESMWEAPV